jgi:hypothetical protein
MPISTDLNSTIVMKTLFPLSLILLGFATMLSAQSAPEPKGLRVEVMVFSGRPNPVFTITDAAQINQILAAAGTLPSASAAAASAQAEVERPKLGYRGILVTNLSDAGSDLQTLRVHRSAVRMTRKQAAAAKAGVAAAAEARTDQSAALENQLLSLARSRGAVDDNLLNLIRNSQ